MILRHFFQIEIAASSSSSSDKALLLLQLHISQAAQDASCTVTPVCKDRRMDKTGKDRTGQDRTGRDGTNRIEGQDRAGQDRPCGTPDNKLDSKLCGRTIYNTHANMMCNEEECFHHK